MMSSATTSKWVAPFVLPAMALWGWQIGVLPWAIGLGLLVECARFSNQRIEISQTDFNRLWNFTTLLFLAVGLYLFLAREGLGSVNAMADPSSPSGQMKGLREISQTALMFLRWMPFVLYPFILAHAWSRASTLPWSTFSLYEQARAKRAPKQEPPAWAVRRVHPAHLFICAALLAASAATTHPLAFLPIFLGVVTLALWPSRSPRYGALAWVLVFVVLLSGSLIVQRSLSVMRSAIEAMENRLLQGGSSARFDQTRTSTAIGTLGRLKLSGSIILRVHTANDEAPGLLREASFSRFRASTWASNHRSFQPVGSLNESQLIRFSTKHHNGPAMTISRYSVDLEVPLDLPGNTISISGLPAANVETNYMGSARMRDAPPLAIYTVHSGEGGGFDGIPDFDDTNIDHLIIHDRQVIQETAEKLGLKGMAPQDAVRAVEHFFLSGEFTYSRWQSRRPDSTNSTGLARFLRESHSGHCEYYATATTLLLRIAGVPTRYAVGFSPDERRGKDWIARGRDAHAWCLAYIDGRWRDIDNTPGIWRDREKAEAAWWEGINDVMSQAWYRFAVWRQEGGNWRMVVYVAGMLVLAYLAFRQLRGTRWRRARQAGSATADTWQPLGMDSEFFEVVRRLEAAYGPRLEHETVRTWLHRVKLPAPTLGDSINRARLLHEKLRFDPAGLPGEERKRLRELAGDLATRIPGRHA